jgi:hypothetical protein
MLMSPDQTTDRSYRERLMDITDEQLTQLLLFWEEARGSPHLGLWMAAPAFLPDIRREIDRRAKAKSK